jgi:hypothetical protein
MAAVRIHSSAYDYGYPTVAWRFTPALGQLSA